MDPQRWKQIQSICASAMNREADERVAYLRQVCAGDEDLLRDAESFLSCGMRKEEFLESNALHAAARDLASSESAAEADLTGRTFLHYRITGKIGKGGMGEVYKAEDVRLGRTVALKFLSGELARDAQALERFKREARAASALNHHNICTLHDIGEHDGQTFLVMEHLSGSSLAERLNRGPLPLDQALDIGAHVAEALDAAHKQGIVHRDLKPGNVMLTKTGPKLLDFGLAKLKKGNPLSVKDDGTRSASLTESGMIMGTVPYMAPEQLEGRTVDARTDVWALGVILYEMISGKRAFEEPSQASLIAAILERDPAPLKDVQPLTPPLLDRVVRKCLAKNPDARWDSAHDIADELRWIRDSAYTPEVTGSDAQRPTRWKWAAIGLLAIAVLAVAAVLVMIENQPSVGVERFTITVPDGLTLASVPTMAVSPDGKTVVFLATRAGQGQSLFKRRVDSYAVDPLPGTEGALSPAFSPDGKWVAYFVMFKELLMKIPIDGSGPPQRICELGDEYKEVWGLTWTKDGRIIFGGWPGGLGSVPPGSDSPQPLLRPPKESTSTYFIWPHLLPDGEHLLFTDLNGAKSSVAALSLKTLEVKPLVKSASRALYLQRTGHLVYQSGAELYAVAFNHDRLEMHDDAVIVEKEVGHAGPFSCFDLSANGSLVYISAARPTLSSLVWRDRSGCVVPLSIDPRPYSAPQISPNGALILDSIFEASGRRIWIGRAGEEPMRQLTSDNDTAWAIFTPDSKAVLFSMPEKGGSYNIFRIPADASGNGKAERITDSSHNLAPTSVFGNVLLYNDTDEANGDVWQMEIGRRGSERRYISTDKTDLGGTFSPDGHWVAYNSDHSGRMEVYLQSYPTLGAEELVSIGGGDSPVWNPKGGELFYKGQNGIVSRRIEKGHAVGPQIQLFPYDTGRFAVNSDGNRFLLIQRTAAQSQINAVTNWSEELKVRLRQAVK